MEHYSIYLFRTLYKQPAFGCWPLAVSSTASSHQHNSHYSLTLAVLPEARGRDTHTSVSICDQMPTAAVPAFQTATSYEQPATAVPRSSKLESAVPAVHLISFISSLISSPAVFSQLAARGSKLESAIPAVHLISFIS